MCLPCIANMMSEKDIRMGLPVVAADPGGGSLDKKGCFMQVYKIRVVIADDHPVIVAGLKQTLSVNTIEVLNTARNSTEVVQLLDKEVVNVLVTDYAMPGGDFGDGLPFLEFILRRFPKMKIVVMTMMDNPGVLRTLITLGVRCIVNKSDDVSHLIPAVHVASAGGQYFSPTVKSIIETLDHFSVADGKAVSLSKREVEVIRLYVAGMKINDIASQLHRSKQTVSSQKNSAMRKIGVASDADLFKYALEVGLVPSSSEPASSG